MKSDFSATWERTRVLLCEFEELLRKHGGESEESRQFFKANKENSDFESYASQLIYQYCDPDARAKRRRGRR